MATAPVVNGDVREIEEKLGKVLGNDRTSLDDDDDDDDDLTNTTAQPPTAPPPPDDAVEKASAILDDLLRFRDRYFESHSWRDAHRKKADVAAEMIAALAKLEKLNDRLTELGRQAFYLTLRGRINNANQVSARPRLD